MEDKLLSELEITSDLDYEFRRQPGLFASYAFKHARAEDKVRQAEEKVDVIFADLYAAYRKKHPDAKENDCKSFIRKRDSYKQAVALVHRAKLTRDILKAGVKAFEMRRDMLMQLGPNERAGWNSTDPTIRRGERDRVKEAAEVLRRKARKIRRKE